MIALNKRESLYIVLLVCVLILVGGAFWLVIPQYKLFTTQYEELNAIQSKSNTLTAQKTTVVQEINRYKYLINETRKKVGYTFPDENQEQRIKGFLRELLTLSTSTGNELIAILPSQTNQQVSIKTLVEDVQPEDKDKDNKNEEATKEAAAVAEKNAQEKQEQQRFTTVKEKSLPLYTTTMDMKIRGSYQSVLGFMGALAKHNTLLKVESFQLSYEALGGAQSFAATEFDVEKPILLVLKIKLYLLEAGFKP
jgi:hypothetical protein